MQYYCLIPLLISLVLASNSNCNISPVKQSRQQVNLAVGNSDLVAYLQDETVIFEIENIATAELFKLELTPPVLQQDLLLFVFFLQPLKLLQYLSGTPQDLTISDKGVIQFTVDVLGDSRKFTIKTKKVEMTQQDLLLRTYRIVQNTQRGVKSIQQKLGIMPISKNQVKIIQKEGNSVMKGEESDKFQIDYKDWTSYLFERYVNRVKKISGAGIHHNFFGKQITANSIFTFKVLHLNIANNYIMTGVGSNRMRGKDNSYGQVGDSALYYSPAPGYLYPGGTALNTGGVQAGQILQIIIDTINWRVTWKKKGSQLASSPIPEKIRNEPLYPVVNLYTVGDEIQFV